MYSSLTVLLAVFSIAHCHGGGGDWHKFMYKYTNVKILTDCFGDDFITKWFKNYTEATNFCKNQSPESYLRGLPLSENAFDEMLATPQGYNPLYSQFPGMEHQSPFNVFDLPASGGGVPQLQESAGGLVDVNDFVDALQGNYSQPLLLVPLPYPLLQQLSHYGSGFYLRKKRETHVEPLYDEKKIERIYDKFQEQAGNFTCVFKRLKIFNEAFDVDVTHIMSLYSSLNLDLELLTDVTEGVMDCIKFATCKPLNKMTLTPPIVQRAMTFLKCEAKQRVASCVKNDVRKMKHKFDLEALGNVKTSNEADEGDKMMAIMWGDFTY